MLGLPTVCPNISRNRKTLVYSMSYAKNVLDICKIDILLSISNIQKKVGHPVDMPWHKKIGFRVLRCGMQIVLDFGIEDMGEKLN